MTEEKAIELFDKWVKILRLGDWDIHFNWRVHPAEMESDDCMGHATYNWVNKQAVIEIADPEKLKMDFPEFGFDYEKTLVHELMHLKLSIIDRDNQDDDMLGAVVHQLVDELAKSLVAARREGAKEENA